MTIVEESVYIYIYIYFCGVKLNKKLKNIPSGKCAAKNNRRRKGVIFLVRSRRDGKRKWRPEKGKQISVPLQMHFFMHHRISILKLGTKSCEELLEL